MYAADLLGVEPTAADLALLGTAPWRDTQEHLEALLTEQATAEPARAVVAPVVTFPTRTANLPEGRAA